MAARIECLCHRHSCSWRSLRFSLFPGYALTRIFESSHTCHCSRLTCWGQLRFRQCNRHESSHFHCATGALFQLFSLSHAITIVFFFTSTSTPVDPSRKSLQPSDFVYMFLYPLCHGIVVEHTIFQLSTYMLCTPCVMELVPQPILAEISETRSRKCV